MNLSICMNAYICACVRVCVCCGGSVLNEGVDGCMDGGENKNTTCIVVHTRVS